MSITEEREVVALLRQRGIRYRLEGASLLVPSDAVEDVRALLRDRDLPLETPDENSGCEELSELKTTTTPDGAVTAHWLGQPPGGENPLEYGVQVLTFTFAGDEGEYAFVPRGELFFSDWRFEILSPDGKWVLLLQDRFGPYHVVAAERLKQYLLGRAAPDEVVIQDAGADALVHGNARWVSADEFEFDAAGRETVTVKHRVSPRAGRK